MDARDPAAPDPRARTAAGTPEPSLEDLVAQALERLEREGPPALEALCRAHPGQATALRARVEQLRAIGFVGAVSRDAPLPERLGGFRILSRLGGGGMGVVFLAEQEGLGRQVALKLVRPDLLHFPGARERFRREVEAVARLAHPGIVPVFAGGEDNGIPFYAMERVRGASLEELIGALAGRDPARLAGAQLRRAVEALLRRRDAAGAGSSAAAGDGQLFAGDWSSACLRIARAVAAALQHAHEQGVLHRDVKPSNIMVTPDGRVLLLDFGLAAARGSERLTGSGAQMGSLAWMSPEQVRGEHASLDARTDVYSLGATLYELLTLRSPFTGGELEDTRRRVLEGRLIPLRDLNPAVPRDAATVCLHAMDPDRERRYADAAAFAEDLGNALELRPVVARRPGALLKARRWAQRNPARATAAALGAVLLVGGPLGYGLLQSRAADEQHRLNTELQRQREEVQRSLAEETRQREASQRHYERALAAVDQMLQQVGAQDLRDLPGFDETRVALLERALAFYRELEAEQPADRAPRVEQARTRRGVADILEQLGRADEASAAFAEAATMLRALRQEAPADPELQQMLAGCLTQLGVLAQAAGHLDEARANLLEASTLFAELVARPDAKADWLRDEAATAFNLARLANDSGDNQEEYRLYLHAVDVLTPLVAAHPDSLDYAVQLAGALRAAATAGLALGHADASEQQERQAYAALLHLRDAHPHDRVLRAELVEAANNLGLLLMSRADRSEALEVLGVGLSASRSLAADFPAEPLYRQHAAALALNVSAELGNQRRFAEAAPLIEESCELLARLVAEAPDNVSHRFYLGAALSVASGMHLELGDPARALREAEDGVARLREVLATLSGSTDVRAQLASAIYQLADVHRAAPDLARALAACEEAFALGGGRPDILFQGAEIVGRLAAAARRAADAAVAARAEELCVALLDEAVTKGFTDIARLRAESFETLQGRPEFEAIVGRLAPAR